MPISTESEAVLVVLSSPSGGGKSTICRALLESDPNMEYSVSVTSRPPRGDESNGQHYQFVSESEFYQFIERGVFYEWAKVHDNLYGTRRDIVEEKLARGKCVVMDLDVIGGLNIKKANDKAVLIFVLPPSLNTLEERLRRRNTDAEEIIQKRLHNARNEINFAEKYDYVVVNEDLQNTIGIIQRIIEAERYSSRHQRVKITGEDALV
jgi:guanylate kinase